MVSASIAVSADDGSVVTQPLVKVGINNSLLAVEMALGDTEGKDIEVNHACTQV